MKTIKSTFALAAFLFLVVGLFNCGDLEENLLPSPSEKVKVNMSHAGSTEYNEGETAQVTFSLEGSNIAQEDIVLTYQIADDSTADSSDFSTNPASNKFTIAEGSNATTLKIIISVDADIMDETLHLTFAVQKEENYSLSRSFLRISIKSLSIGTKPTPVGTKPTPVGTKPTPVNKMPDFGNGSVPDKSWRVGSAIDSFTVPEAAGSSDTLSYSASGLPSGVTMSTTTRVVSGTPAANTAGSGTAIVTVTDEDGNDDTLAFNWTVAVHVEVQLPPMLERKLCTDFCVTATGLISPGLTGTKIAKIERNIVYDYTYQVSKQISDAMNSVRKECANKRSKCTDEDYYSCTSNENSEEKDKCLPSIEFKVDDEGYVRVENINTPLGSASPQLIYFDSKSFAQYYYTHQFTADEIEVTATSSNGGPEFKIIVELEPFPRLTECESKEDEKERTLCNYAETQILPAGYPKKLVDTENGEPTPEDPALDVANILAPGSDHPEDPFLKYPKTDYQLIFSQEFEGDDLMHSVWNLESVMYESPTRDGKSCALSFEDGYLKIQPEEYESGKWCLFSMNTQGKFEFRYGYVQIGYKVKQSAMQAWTIRKKTGQGEWLVDDNGQPLSQPFVMSVYLSGRYMYGGAPPPKLTSYYGSACVNCSSAQKIENVLRIQGAEIDLFELAREQKAIEFYAFERQTNAYARKINNDNTTSVDGALRFENEDGDRSDEIKICMYDIPDGSSCDASSIDINNLPEPIEFTYVQGFEWSPDEYRVLKNEHPDENTLSTLWTGLDRDTRGESVGHSVAYLIHTMWSAQGKIDGDNKHIQRPVSNSDLSEQIQKIDYIRVYQPKNKYSDITPVYTTPSNPP